MNTIQCPVCKQELEGDFQMTDPVKCPTCETAFVPANVLARRKEPIVLKTRGADDSNTFDKKDAGVHDSEPLPRDASRENPFQETTHETRNERPKQIVWTVATWIGALVFRNIVLFCFVVVALATGDNAFFESEIALYFTSCFLVLPVSIAVAWQLYKGKIWAKTLYSVFAFFSLLSTPIYHFGTKAMSMDSMVRNHLTFHPNWVLNIGVLWGVVVLVVFVCGLRWVNQKESRAWLKSKKCSNNNTPWWIWALLFNLLSIVALIVMFKSSMGISSKEDQLGKSERPVDSKQVSFFQDYFATRKKQKKQEQREAAEQKALGERGTIEKSEREARELAKRKAREDNEARELVERKDHEVKNTIVQKPTDTSKESSIIGDSLEQNPLVLSMRKNGLSCLEKARVSLQYKNYEAAIEQFQNAAQYFSNETIPESDLTTKQLWEQANSGLAETYFQQALSRYQDKRYKVAVSSCLLASRYSHPKARELLTKIQNAEEEAKQQAVNEAAQRLRSAQSFLSYDLNKALDEYRTAEKELNSVTYEKSEPAFIEIRAQIETGLGEVHFRFAESFLRMERFNEALAACRSAKSFHHPQADVLYDKIRAEKERKLKQ